MKNKYILLLIYMMCLLISCIMPSIEDDDSIEVAYQVRVIAPDSLLYFPGLSLKEVLEIDEDLTLWLTSELYEVNGMKRYLLERYNNKFDVYSQTLNSYTLKSNADYLLLYFLEFKRSQDSFYEIDNLTNVKLRGQNNTIHIEPNKEAFVGKTELKGGSKDFCDTIILKSPFSFYLLQATDLITFIEKHRDLMLDSIDVNVKYLSYYPYAFDIFAMRPVDSGQNYSYRRRIPVEDNESGYLELGYDILFMGEERSIASIRVTISDSYSQRILSSRNVQFDYFLRDRKVVQGNFLTGKQDGIIVDTAFQDDIIVEF